MLHRREGVRPGSDPALTPPQIPGVGSDLGLTPGLTPGDGLVERTQGADQARVVRPQPVRARITGANLRFD